MREFIYISWLNPIGGFEYWLFTGYKDHLLEVSETGQTKTNTFPNWPKSYGAFADTITKQTFRKTRKQRVIRSQVLTATQAQEMGEQIRSSPLVQIITTRRDRRTVIVDSDSVTVRKERDKIHGLSFTITYTDDYNNQHV
jgi:hypothetical protein